jgi:hypothetical protein
MIRYSCDLSGAVTRIVSTLGAANHVDECCGDETEAAAFCATDDCCQATVFSLPPTSPAPNQLVDDVPVMVSLALLTPATTERLTTARHAPPASPSLTRNLPLLV